MVFSQPKNIPLNRIDSYAWEEETNPARLYIVDSGCETDIEVSANDRIVLEIVLT
jgi:hypothetical protein